VTIHLTNVSLTRAIDSVSRVANVFVQYQSTLLRQYSRPVTVDATQVPLGVLLEQILTGTTLRVVAGGPGNLTIVPSEGIAGDSVPGVGTINGRVVDSATGRGIAGVAVAVTGTKVATLTREDGRFTLSRVPTGAHVVTAKLFGYRPVSRPAEVTAIQPVTLVFQLTSMPNVLSGVVTTATGMQRKITVGNDITTINVDSVMQTAPIHTVTDLLETRVPGLTVTHSSGEPGAPSRIRLRGASSITGNNDPIVIVDGVRVYASQSDTRNNNLAPSVGGNTNRYTAPSPLDQVDPNSIETIEVFKGPSASSQYGADAANGVIVITTKKGRPGPAKWLLDLDQGVNWIPGSWPDNYYRFGLGVFNQATGSPLCDWNDASCHVDSTVAFQALNDSRYSVFSHGIDQSASLNIRGGASTLTYSLTGSGSNVTGNLKLPAIERQRYEKFYGSVPNYLIRPDKHKRWSLNGQITARPTSTVNLALTSILSDEATQTGSLNQAIGQLLGVYIDPTQLASTTLLKNDVERATDNQRSSTTALQVDWQFRPQLMLTITGGVSTNDREDVTYIPFGVNSCVVGASAIGDNTCGDTTGHYGYGRGSSQDKTAAIRTQIPLPFLTLGLGTDLHVATTSDFMAENDQLAPGVTVPTTFCLGLQFNLDRCGTLGTTAISTYGWYAQPTLNLRSRFFVSPGFRLDGGSASGSRAGLTGFPKIDVSYIMIDETRPVGPISLFRPRLAFGYAGTQPSPADRLRLLNANNSGQTVSLDGGLTYVPVVKISTVGNTQLRPEKKRELETGAELDLWHNRVSMIYSYYNSTRIDAIISVPLAASVSAAIGGFGSIATNIGVVRNTGHELTLTTQLLQTRAVGWTVGGNFSANRNRVVRLNPGQSALSSGNGTQRVVAGYPLWGTWARPITAFADKNGDNIIERGEIRYGDSSVYVGQSDPKYQAAFTTDVNLGSQIGLHAGFAMQHGMTQINSVALNSGALALLPNAPGATLATQASVGAAQAAQGTKLALTQTVNTFRFNDLSITYNLPTAITGRMRVPWARLALQGSNLGLHTNYRGKDPNVNAFATSGSTGDWTEDGGQVPLPRLWRLSLSLGN
jgi:TonB-dependent SusC/RagA subfamily outer membrane receptor